MKQEVVVLICDMCGDEDGTDTLRGLVTVHTHSMVLDGHAVEAEACERCWEKYLAAFVTFRQIGRKPKKVKAKEDAIEVVPFPGTRWHFTYHALLRMGERRLNPLDVIQAAEKPKIVHAGRTPDSEIRILGNLKVTIQPEKRRVITAGYREAEDKEATAV